MADWEEIKRLAADFQKVQLSSTSQKLSERNCIEIITWLKERKIIDLIFTVDGKEFLTPAQLVQDIKNELIVSGGRVNLVELARLIGVDLAHITTHMKDVLKGQKDIHSVLGQLIDNSYIVKIAGEINEKLQQQGQINISELTIHYDLPAEFIQQQVEKHLGKIIQGKQDHNDPKVFFTESFIARCKSKIRGALTGLTRPTSVASILNQIGMADKLFFSLFDQTGALFGSLTSRSVGAQYIPNIYARSQNEWIQSFYKQNSYLEFDTLTRLGISDYKSYIRKHFSGEQVLSLHSCVISKRILERCDADIEECIASKSYLDMQANLPSVFNDKDIATVLEMVLTKQKQQQTVIIGNFLISTAFIDKLSAKFEVLIKEKAKAVVESGKYQQHQTDLQVLSSAQASKGQKLDDFEDKVDKREERRKKASAGGKSGGGTQGRESKTKSTKKGGRGKHVVDDDEVSARAKKTLEIFVSKDVREVIDGDLDEEGLDELKEPIATYLLPQINEKALQAAAALYQSTVAADRSANRRQTHNELQNKLNALIGDVRLFEKGLKLLADDMQTQLVKYLLKTLCTDIVSEVLNYIAAEQNVNVSTDNFNHDQRMKFVNDLPVDLKKSLVALVKSLQGQSVDEFMGCIEDGLSACSMIVKKIDKKKDRTIVLNHKHVLLEQMNKCEDLALVLHLAVLVIFTTATQCMLHASGRHVNGVLGYLKQFLSEEQSFELSSYHDFVTLMLSGGSEAENAKEKLKEKVSVVRNIANEFKKPGAEKS